ncbi:MAG: hypothetical protein ACRESZ_07530 [Methylococcales bacterium]
MSIWKRFFSSGSKSKAESAQPPAHRTVPPATPAADGTLGSKIQIEDVRPRKDESGEIILNLWYVTNRMIISELRGKAYVASGTDDEKLSFLRSRFGGDYRVAQVFPIPEEMRADITLLAGSTTIDAGKGTTDEFVKVMGGYVRLFRDVFLAIPKGEFRFDPAQPLVVITPLLKGSDGALSVRVDRRQGL